MREGYDGFVALVSVIVLTAIIGIAALTSLSIQSSRILSDESMRDSVIARINANSCAEKALKELVDDLNYLPGEEIDLVSGKCKVTNILGTGHNNRSIVAQGEYGASLKRVVVDIAFLYPFTKIHSWEELRDSNYCLSFDGTIETVHTYSLSYPTTEFTLSAWARPSTLGGGLEIVADSVDRGFALQKHNGDYWYMWFHIVDEDWEFVRDTSLKINQDQWYHLVGIFSSSSGEMKLYIDGVEKALTNIPVGSVLTQTGQVSIGGMWGNRFFTGEIDDVRVYSRVLTEDEINLLYQGVEISPVGLVDHRNFCASKSY